MSRGMREGDEGGRGISDTGSEDQIKQLGG